MSAGPRSITISSFEGSAPLLPILLLFISALLVALIHVALPVLLLVFAFGLLLALALLTRARLVPTLLTLLTLLSPVLFLSLCHNGLQNK